jgi:hypothetical protein
MKQSVAFFVLALILVAHGVQAQTTYAFKVLVSKGKSEIKTATDWEPLKTGASLQPSDEIRVSQNAYLGLMPAEGQPIELREAKVHKVSDLVKKVSRGSTALNKYTDFILSKEEEKKGRLSATGAVVRGIKGLIMVYLPEQDQATLYGDRVVIQWFSEDVKPPYEVVFTSMMGEELGRYTTELNWVSIPVNEGKFKNESNLMVKVISKTKPGQGSKDYYIKKLKGNDRQVFDEKLKDAKTGKSALDRYVMAGIYEENFLLIDALNAYNEAATLAPDVDLYKTAYEEFVKRLESVLGKE